MRGKNTLTLNESRIAVNGTAIYHDKRTKKTFREILRNISVIEQAEGLGEQRVPQMEWIFGGVYG